MALELAANDRAGGTVSADNMGFSVGVAYETGPWGVSFVWKHGEREDLIADRERGGSCDGFARFARSADRISDINPTSRFIRLGFRPAFDNTLGDGNL